MTTVVRALLPALLLCGCANLEASGLYTSTPPEASPTGYAATRIYAPGSVTSVPLSVNLNGAAPTDRLVLATLNAGAPDGELATFDGGRVKVTWDGVPVLAADARVTVTVAPDATPTGPAVDALYTTTSQVILRKATHLTSRAGTVTVGIRVGQP